MIVAGLFLVSTVSGADWWTNYSETFEDDTAGTDPSASWYTFTDTAWATATTVAEDVYRTGNHSYEIDDTDGNNDYTYFNWTSDTHNYFQFYFKIDNSTHETISFTPTCSLGIIGADVTIYGMGAIEPYIKFENFTGVKGFANYTISNDTWYLLRWDFNYTTHEIKVSVYDNNSVLKTSGWVRSEAETGNVDYVDSTGMYIWGTNGKDVQIWFDDMQLSELQDSQRLRDSDSFGAIQLALILLILPVLVLVLLYKFYVMFFDKKKKPELNDLIVVVITIVMLVVIASFL
jgi:hypothetical protein